MAKIPVKKTSAKKSAKASTKTKIKTKKPGKSAARKVVRKDPTEKERALRAANLIANSEKKKKPVSRRPKKTASAAQTTGLLDAIVDGMQEKKAKNIMVLNLTEIENRVTDYFVICDADSRTHVNSISESVEELVEKHSGEKVYHSEGQQNGEWILLDYINIVAHVFLRESREYYNLEALWGDAEFTLIND